MKLRYKSERNIFEVTICGDDHRLERPKPAPDIFILCTNTLNAAPEDRIVFQDSLNSIKGAALAGIKMCALPSAFLDDKALKSANLLFSNYHERLPIIIDW